MVMASKRRTKTAPKERKPVRRPSRVRRPKAASRKRALRRQRAHLKAVRAERERRAVLDALDNPQCPHGKAKKDCTVCLLLDAGKVILEAVFRDR